MKKFFALIFGGFMAFSAVLCSKGTKNDDNVKTKPENKFQHARKDRS